MHAPNHVLPTNHRKSIDVHVSGSMAPAVVSSGIGSDMSTSHHDAGVAADDVR